MQKALIQTEDLKFQEDILVSAHVGGVCSQRGVRLDIAVAYPNGVTRDTCVWLPRPGQLGGVRLDELTEEV